MKVNQSQLILIPFVFIVTIMALYVVRELDIYYPVRITNNTQSDFVITGEGKVEVVPDTAYLDAGISVSNEASAQSAREKINAVNNKIVQLATQNGIAKEDIKTSNYSINPQMIYSPDSSAKPTTYFGNASVTIKTKDLSKAENLTTILTQAEANNVSVRFGVDDPNVYREQAREKAITNAKEQAQKLATTLGIELGRVTNAVEGSTSTPVFYERGLALDSKAAGGSTPELEPGTQTISTSMTLYFEKR